MSADLLRKAAREMREKAKACLPTVSGEGWWTAEGFSDVVLGFDESVQGVEADAEHIASWHPAVALAVADQLDDMADVLDGAAGTPLELAMTAISNRSVAVARAYLGANA